MKLGTTIILVGSLSMLGCTKPPAQTSLSATPVPAERLHRAPLAVSVDGPKAPVAGAEFDIKVLVERVGGARGSVTLVVALPAGVDLVQGTLRETVGGTEGRIERTLKVRASAIPDEDLKIIASSSGHGWGVRATGAYRFGRPEPRLPQPPRSGPPLIVHGHNLGQGIPLGALPDGGPHPR